MQMTELMQQRLGWMYQNFLVAEEQTSLCTKER